MSDPSKTVPSAPPSATITFDINGETVPAHDASWYQIAPCGCAAGVTVVTLHDSRMTPRLTEEDAWAAFYEGRAELRRRDQAAGFTMQLGHRSAVVEMMRECEHEPRWGIAPTPTLDGHEWATTDRIPASSGRQHLVPVESVIFDAGHLGRRDSKTTALCGRSDWYWFHDKPWVKDAPTCRRCEKKATERTGGA